MNSLRNFRQFPVSFFVTVILSVNAVPYWVVAADAETSGGWRSMFDGESLKNWSVLEGGEFESAGKVVAEDGAIVIGAGESATGVRWTQPFPATNYELRLEGKRVAGEDFFCGLTFPVESGSASLIMGGWGGWVVGLSKVDGRYAIDNTTCQAIRFKQGQWYRMRVQVTPSHVKVWVDDDEIIDLAIEGVELAVSSELKPCLPVGIATWKTTGAIRRVRYRPLLP